MSKAPAFNKKNRINRKRSKAKVHSKKRDPLCPNGERMRPVFVDFKDVELLKKLTSRQGKIIGRRKTGCSSVSQHAVSAAIKRARFVSAPGCADPYAIDHMNGGISRERRTVDYNKETIL